MKLVFATHNQNKFIEAKALMPREIELLSLTDLGCFDEIPETGSTLLENAKIKSDFIHKKYDLPCFSDDTGLLVEALNEEPGVFSARYAGPSKDSEANIQKVLIGLKDHENRSARFETVISLFQNGTQHFFKGIVSGIIIKELRGDKGFGYDPIFIPDGFEQTFAELPLSTKNLISHRGKAIALLTDYLAKNIQAQK